MGQLKFLQNTMVHFGRVAVIVICRTVLGTDDARKLVVEGKFILVQVHQVFHVER